MRKKQIVQAAVPVLLSFVLLSGCSADNTGTIQEINGDTAAFSEKNEETVSETEAGTETTETAESETTKYDNQSINISKLYNASYTRHCELCGLNYYYMQIESSDYMTEEQINKVNSDLDKLAEKGIGIMRQHVCNVPDPPVIAGSITTPYENWNTGKLNLWRYSDKDAYMTYYDPDTFEMLSWEDLLGENWQDYRTDKSSDDDSDEGYSDILCHGDIRNIPEKECIQFCLSGITDDFRITAEIPWENINQKYITEPEGWSEINEKIPAEN